MAPHNPLGPVSTAACVALCTAIPNFGVLELVVAARRDGRGREGRADARTRLPRAERGAGLGVELDEAAVADHPFERWELMHLKREDGAFADW